MTPPLTAAELAELERLEKLATGGEWFDDSYGAIGSSALVAEYERQESLLTEDDTDEEWGKLPQTVVVCAPQMPPRKDARHDIAFLVALRNAFPALLATIRALQEREREWVASMPRCDHYDCSNRATRQSVPGKDYTRCDDCGPAGVTWVDLPHAHLIRSAP